jgi:catechol 2,3-dioxygenase-like lactoylglutathione lyase family enzyme
MIDHTGISVSNFAASKTFYAQALARIGYQLLMELPVMSRRCVISLAS